MCGDTSTHRVSRLLMIPVAVLGTAAAAFLLGMRFRVPFVVNGVRRMNRKYMNPRQLETAGKPGAYAAVLHHTGRKSGKPYVTPIGVTRVDDTFVTGLPYGAETDWLRNFIAAGSATLDYEGETVVVDQPRVVPVTTMRHAFPPAELRAQRLFGIEECLVMHRAD